ncbi:MAG: hypothetical protein RI542_08270, partial [Wenzhouxiangella sp.]|nr:hypothetical protein [Wenzhouxiangella sp.]
EQVDARDLKSLEGNFVPVRFRPRAPSQKKHPSRQRLAIPSCIPHITGGVRQSMRSKSKGWVVWWTLACALNRQSQSLAVAHAN